MKHYLSLGLLENVRQYFNTNLKWIWNVHKWTLLRTAYKATNVFHNKYIKTSLSERLLLLDDWFNQVYMSWQVKVCTYPGVRSVKQFYDEISLCLSVCLNCQVYSSLSLSLLLLCKVPISCPELYRRFLCKSDPSKPAVAVSLEIQSGK